MSTVFQCDRCKRVTKTRMTGFRLYNLQEKESGALHHLCGYCYRKLKQWFSRANIKPNKVEGDKE